MQQSTITKIEAAADELGIYLRAAESWHPQYEKDPKSFKTMLAAEQRLLRSMRKYFRQLPERGQHWVNWREYLNHVKAAAKAPVITVTLDDAEEEGIIMRLVFDDMTVTMAAGAQGGERIYNVPLGISKSSQAIVDAARARAADLVKDINDTTRARVNSSVSTSLQLGENIKEATDRLNGILNDPVRAERVARTESVGSYNIGLDVFGVKSGAESKTWQLAPTLGKNSGDLCPICSPLDNVTVGIDEDFDSQMIGGGPPGHPNCRCGKLLNYPDNSSSDEPAADDSGD